MSKTSFSDVRWGKAQQTEPRAKKEGGSPTDRQIPWLWIAVGGSVVWALFVLVMALDGLVPSRSQPQQQRGPVPVVVDVRPEPVPGPAVPEQVVKGQKDDLPADVDEPPAKKE